MWTGWTQRGSRGKPGRAPVLCTLCPRPPGVRGRGWVCGVRAAPCPATPRARVGGVRLLAFSRLPWEGCLGAGAGRDPRVCLGARNSPAWGGPSGQEVRQPPWGLEGRTIGPRGLGPQEHPVPAAPCPLLPSGGHSPLCSLRSPEPLQPRPWAAPVGVDRGALCPPGSMHSWFCARGFGDTRLGLLPRVLCLALCFA